MRKWLLHENTITPHEIDESSINQDELKNAEGTWYNTWEDAQNKRMYVLTSDIYKLERELREARDKAYYYAHDCEGIFIDGTGMFR